VRVLHVFGIGLLRRSGSRFLRAAAAHGGASTHQRQSRHQSRDGRSNSMTRPYETHGATAGRAADSTGVTSQ
jgi:hypothetical protein